MLRLFVIATTALATVLATIFGLAAGADASDWRTNPDAYESGVFLDVSSYKLLPNGDRQIWILQTFQKPVETSDGLVDFQVSQFEFNCPQRTLAVKFTEVYFMDGKSEPGEKDPAASPRPSDASAERMSDVVCGDMSRLTAVSGEAPVIAHRYRAIGKMALQ